LQEKSVEYIAKKWEYIGLPQHQDRDAIKQEMNDEIKMGSIVDDIEKRLFPVNGKRILDVGCGIGGLVIAFKLKGAQAIGFDEDVNAIKVCKLRAKYYGFDDCFFIGSATSIPFREKSFDLVTATGVLEHVRNPEEVIKEMVRVGKNIYITISNPLYPREGHYKIFWIPYLPKALGKLYLRFRKFNPEFFEKHVHYISASKVKRLLERNGMHVENVVEQNTLIKLSNPSQIDSPNLKKIAQIIKLFRLSKIVAKLYAIFSPSITLIGKSNKQIAREQYNDPERYDKRYLLNETERYFHDRWHPFLISKIKELCKDKLVLDLGCGTCEFTQYMKDAKLVVGLDLSIYMLKYGLTKIKDQNFHLIHGDACKLPVKSEMVDLIFCIGLLPYVDIDSLFGECERVLKNNGEVMCVFPNKWNFLNLQGRLLRKIAQRLGKKISSREEHSYREIKKSLENFGFTVKEMKCFGMVTYCPLFLQKYAKYLWILMDKIYAPFQSIFPLGSSIMVIAQKSNKSRKIE